MPIAILEKSLSFFVCSDIISPQYKISALFASVNIITQIYFIYFWRNIWKGRLKKACLNCVFAQNFAILIWAISVVHINCGVYSVYGTSAWILPNIISVSEVCPLCEMSHPNMIAWQSGVIKLTVEPSFRCINTGLVTAVLYRLTESLGYLCTVFLA